MVPTPTSDRGVSPVIGVVLMVAITIILAAAIGAFVFDLTPTDEQSPLATVSIEEADDTGSVTLVHDGGDTLDLDDHTLVVDGSVTAGNDSMEGTLQSGQRDDIPTDTSDDEVEVALRHDPSGDIIARATVEIG